MLIAIARFRSTALFMAGFSLSAAASAATDIELRAAYCIPIAKNAISVFHGTPVAAEYEDRLKRLEAYVVPKIMAIGGDLSRSDELVAYELAMKRGEQDAQRQRALLDSIRSECYWRQDPGAKTACITELANQNKDLGDRARKCHELDWLPF